MRISYHLRSELFPYIYSSTAQSTRESVPLLRPMYFDNPRVEAAYHNGQEYLLGDDLLVAPVASPGVGPNRVGQQAVWFPGGSDWFNTFTGEKISRRNRRVVRLGHQRTAAVRARRRGRSRCSLTRLA